MVFVLGFITSSNLTHSFIVCIQIMMFFIVTEFIISIFFSVFQNISVAGIINNPKAKFHMSIAVKAIQCIIIVLIYKNKKFEKIICQRSLSKFNNFIVNYFLLGNFLMAIFIFSMNYANSFKNNILMYEVLSFLIFLIFIILGALDFKEEKKLLQINNKYKLQQEYIKNIETVIDIVRREKHDFINHINTVYALCMLNKPDALQKIKDYLNKVVDNLQFSYHYYNTGNDYIDGLLAVKSNFAFNHNIHFDVYFENLLDHVDMDDYDLITVLGNLIDNSFESLLSEPNHDGKVVSVYGYIEDENYYLSVSDNGPEISDDLIEKIFEKGYSTKKLNSNNEEHGFGLYIIKNIIKKNKGTIMASSYKEETEFLIKLNIRKDQYGTVGAKHYKANTVQ